MFPTFMALVGRTFRFGLNRRQFAHPTFPIARNRHHLRLLEHDFGNPDAVGITRAPPREVASGGGEPFEEEWGELARGVLRVACCVN